MSKKIMSVMLAIFMLASLCVVSLSSASALTEVGSSYHVGYRMTGSTGGYNYAKAGDTITVTLTANTNGHYTINGQMELFYDNTKLKFNEKNKTEMLPNLYVPGNSLIYRSDFTDEAAPMPIGIHFNYSTIEGIDITTDNVIYKYEFTVLEDVDDLASLFVHEFHVFGLFEEAGKPTNANYFNAVAADNSGLINGVTATLSITGGSVKPTEPQPTEIDTTKLANLLIEARALAADDKYTEASIAALNAEIANADAVLAAPESQAQVDAQVLALQTAIDNLVLVEEPTGTTEPKPTDPSETDPSTTEPTETDPTTAPTTSTTTTSTTSATTEAPEAPQTGEESTAVVLMIVAIMAAGVVIFARKKAVK